MASPIPNQARSILLTDPHLKGGGQVRYVVNLAEQLLRLGHSVTIGCKPGSVLADQCAAVGAQVLDTLEFRGGLRPFSWRHDLREIQKFIRSTRPDILHVSGSQDHWVCALANRLMGRPVCLVRTRHNTYIVRDGLPNRILNRAWTDYQIVVCETVRRDLSKQRAFDPERMCSIHNGADAEQFKPDAAARERLRKAFGFEPDHLVVGIAARLVPAKGHAFLLRAAAKIQDQLPNLRLLILGQGNDEMELRALAESIGLVSRIVWAGFRDDMPACVQAFDIGIQPSIDCDTSSFSLKEQMAAEKPVIASDYGGLVEIVSDGEEGVIVPAGTVDPIAEAILKLASDADLRKKMGQRGRARVLREFTTQMFGERTAAAYERAIEVHRERTAH